MKYLLIFSSMLLMACNNSTTDCDCSQLRWQRTVDYQGTSDNVVATTDWNAQGTEEPINTTDCTADGTIAESGVVSTEVLTNGNIRKTEYEYRVTCF